MAEEQRGSRGKSYGNHKSYGSGKPGDRGGKGFKPRGNGGKSYGHKSGGFHNDDHKADTARAMAAISTATAISVVTVRGKAGASLP